MNRPFLPSEIAKPDPLSVWYRGATALALRAVDSRNDTLEGLIERRWGDDRGTSATAIRAAVSPATTGNAPALVAARLGAFLDSLRPLSAAAQLFDAAARLNMEGAATVSLPQMATGLPVPLFVAEAGVIPALQGTLSAVALTRRKMAMLTAITGELANYSTEDAEQIVRLAINDAAARAIDVAVFDAAVADATRPAGLLNGVSAISAASGGGVAAMLADLKAVVGAIVDGGGGSSIQLFMSPRQAVAASILAAGELPYPVIPAPSLAAGTVVAVDAGAIATGFGTVPEITASEEATIHFEDAAPQAIGTAGTPNVVAAPVRNAFQSNLIVLRMLLPAAWVKRSATAVQYITGATW